MIQPAPLWGLSRHLLCSSASKNHGAEQAGITQYPRKMKNYIHTETYRWMLIVILICSCLENPRDGGALWAAVYGVAQSWTRQKRLSSSSSSSSIDFNHNSHKLKMTQTTFNRWAVKETGTSISRNIIQNNIAVPAMNMVHVTTQMNSREFCWVKKVIHNMIPLYNILKMVKLWKKKTY